MMRLFAFLLDGCWHVWRPTTQSTYNVKSEGRKVATGPCVYVVCEKCGKRKIMKDATIGDWEKAR